MSCVNLILGNLILDLFFIASSAMYSHEANPYRKQLKHIMKCSHCQVRWPFSKANQWKLLISMKKKMDQWYNWHLIKSSATFLYIYSINGRISTVVDYLFNSEWFAMSLISRFVLVNKLDFDIGWNTYVCFTFWSIPYTHFYASIIKIHLDQVPSFTLQL